MAKATIWSSGRSSATTSRCRIEKDMNIVVHPTYIHGGYLNWLCDNYLIGGNGPGDRLHQFPEEVVEVG